MVMLTRCAPRRTRATTWPSMRRRGAQSAGSAQRAESAVLAVAVPQLTGRAWVGLQLSGLQPPATLPPGGLCGRCGRWGLQDPLHPASTLPPPPAPTLPPPCLHAISTPSPRHLHTICAPSPLPPRASRAGATSGARCRRSPRQACPWYSGHMVSAQYVHTTTEYLHSNCIVTAQ